MTGMLTNTTSTTSRSTGTTMLPLSPPHRHPCGVAFNNKTQVYLIPSLDEYTDDEIQASFTTKQDNKRNQLDIVTNIADARAHGVNAEGICIRGLEYLVNPNDIQERKIAKERHYDAILDEQDRQWDAGVYPTDWDSIAKASLRSSQDSRDKAQMIGARDAVVARRINDNVSAATGSSNNKGKINKRRSSVETVASHRRSSSFLECSLPETEKPQDSEDVSTISNQFNQLSA